MVLRPHNNSNRAFIWTTMADLSDNEPKQELLAIRFQNDEGESLVTTTRYTGR